MGNEITPHITQYIDELPNQNSRNMRCGMVDKALRLRRKCETIVTAKRSTYVEPKQAKDLGRLLRRRREELGLSKMQLARQVGTNDATIFRIEEGQFTAPAPDKLSRIAEVLALSLADVFALADYSIPSDLPSFQPYLRTKYRDLPPEAVEQLDRAFQRLAKRHGLDAAGPAPGEDEQPEEQPTKRKKGGRHAPTTKPRSKGHRV
jgi:transcriptional regulator with XRE-family HTH domain